MSEKIITEALEKYDFANRRWETNRLASKFDLDFGRLGNQWPEEIVKRRKAENRPMLTINRIPAFLRQVVNNARSAKPSIKVRPVDSVADPKTAQVIQGLIRSIENQSDADIAYDTSIDNSASCGIGFIRVDMDYAHNDTFDMDILIKPIENVQSVLFDAETKAFDSSDWNYCFVSDMIPTKEFERQHPGADTSDFRGVDLSLGWFNEDGIRVAEYWTRDEISRNLLLLSNGMTVDAKAIAPRMEQLMAQGITPVRERKAKGYEVTHRLLTGNEVLKETKWVGSIIPIVPVYGEVVNFEGRRYWRSLFRDAIDSQRMLNFWRTASTELVALSPKAPYIGPEDAFEGLEDLWGNANTESYAYLPYKGQVAPQRQPMSQIPSAAISEALSASDNMKEIMGIYDASLGQKSNETSGKAIGFRQAQSDISTMNFIDNLSRSIRCVGRIVVEMIPLVYTTEREIRVLGDDNKEQNVIINQKTQGADGLDEVLNDLTAGKYDITVESGPSYSTRRQEASEAMVELVRSFPDAAPVLGDLIAKNMDWPDADKVSERLHFLLPPEIRKMEDEKKNLADGGEDAVKAALAQTQQAMQEKDQQIAQMEQVIQEGQGMVEKGKASLDSQKAQIDKKALDVQKQMNDLEMEQERLKLTQKAVTDEINLAVERAQLMLTKSAMEADAADRDAEKMGMADEEDAMHEQMEAASRDQILAEAMDGIRQALTVMAAPKSVSMVGADGRTRTAVVNPQPAAPPPQMPAQMEPMQEPTMQEQAE